MTKNLSVFFPCFNEEGSIETTVKKAIQVLNKLNLNYEIIIVNDGSTDKTAEVADNLSKQNSKVKVIHHPTNLGYGEALKSGFYNSKYEVIVYTDGDGQFDFSEVTKFLEKIGTHDLIIGYRIKRKDPFFRILFKQGWKVTLWTMFGLTLKDVDCGFKMIKKEILENIAHLESQRGAMINAELAIKVKKKGFRVGEVGVNHFPRLSGKPTGANIKVILSSYLDLLRLWWKLKDEKVFFLLLTIVIVLAAFFRFYRLSEYMTFLGDEGRDALIMKKMLSGDIPLIGPPSSVGNVYLGPLYYYMMFVPMAIFKLNPVSAAAMNGLIGILTVALIYYLGKVWFGRLCGLIGAYFYAISPVTIIYSRSSWNPNPTPFFALLGIFSLFKLHKSGNFFWLTLTGFSLAAALQMHYLALLLIPTAIILWIREVWWRKTKFLRIKGLISGTVLGLVTFFAIMSPLIIFDFKHNFLNFRAITALLGEGSSVNFDLISNLAKIPQLYSYNLIGRYVASQNNFLQIALSLLIIFPVLFIRKWAVLALAIWLGVGLLGVSFYQQSVYDHYLGFLNPAPFLLLGSIAAIKIAKKRLTTPLLVVLITILTVVNLQKSPLNLKPNDQMGRTISIAKFVINEAGGKDFNFALLAKNNYDAAYQFYLDQFGHKPKQVPFDKTDQLFVVCEDQICDPTHSPKYELAAFGMSKVDWEKDFLGVKIYKLIPNPSGKP